MQELIHCTQQDKDMLSIMHKIVAEVQRGHTDIQIREFILNDLENPTPYGKFMQVRLELSARYGRLVDLHYDIRETEAKIKIKQEEIEQATGATKELYEVQKERLEVELHGKNSAFLGLLDETRRIFQIYLSMPELHNLTPEEAYKLELEYWQKKTKNMPQEFDNKYGASYMTRMLGQEDYNHYRALRAKTLGLLPRELFLVKQIDNSGVE